MMSVQGVLLFLAGCGIAFGALKTGCPPPESINHCSCRLGDEFHPVFSGPSVTCKGINGTEDLESVLSVLDDYALEGLEISDTTLKFWPADLFDDSHVGYLKLDNFEVEDEFFRPGRRYFEGLEKSMTVLVISNSFNKLTPLANLRLDHLKHLEGFMANDNQITEIGNAWFPNGPSSLSILLFSRCGTKKLGDKAFQSLENLSIFGVSGGELKEVSRSMLPSPAKKLEKIDLSGNKLKKLPSDFFSKMPSLSAVNIKDNTFSTLDEDVWSSSLLQSVRVYAEGNPLQCDANLKWVCKHKDGLVSGRCAGPSEFYSLTVKEFCQVQRDLSN